VKKGGKQIRHNIELKEEARYQRNRQSTKKEMI